MRILLVFPLLALAACDASQPIQAGATLRTDEGPINELGITATEGGEFTVSGEARIGVSGSF